MTVLRSFAAAVAAALVVAAGCGADRTAAPAEFATPGLTTPRPGLHHTRVSPWDGALVDGTTLYLRYTAEPAPCGLPDRVTVTEAGDVVTIALYVGVDPAVAAESSPGVVVACRRAGVVRTVRVELPGPVEGRTFSDAAEPGSRRSVVVR